MTAHLSRTYSASALQSVVGLTFMTMGSKAASAAASSKDEAKTARRKPMMIEYDGVCLWCCPSSELLRELSSCKARLGEKLEGRSAVCV